MEDHKLTIVKKNDDVIFLCTICFYIYQFMEDYKLTVVKKIIMLFLCTICFYMYQFMEDHKLTLKSF